MLLHYTQTQDHNGDTPYNEIPLDTIPTAATEEVITGQSVGRAIRHAHLQRIAERRQVNRLLCIKYYCY